MACSSLQAHIHFQVRLADIDTHNLRTYYTNVGWVFLAETVILYIDCTVRYTGVELSFFSIALI